jgi:glycosyltransferase involved in cell wall biosynthesis
VTRVLFVCPSLGLGGAERQWSLLVPELAARGFDVSLLTLDGEGPFYAELAASGIETRCARMRGRFDVRALVRVFRRDVTPDVVVSRSVSGLVVGNALARRDHAFHISAEHTDYSLLQLSLHRRALMRLVAPRVDLAIAVARAQVPSLLAHGYARDQLRVISNGVDASRLVARRSRIDVRCELGIADSEFLALLVATLRPEKRALDFVAAVSQAHSVNPRIRGVIAGGGPELEPVRAGAASTGQVVAALGPRNDVADLMHAADVVCLTSSHEALPMSLLEAMAVGRAVVATAVGGVPELVEDGRTGLLADVGDASGFAKHLLAMAERPDLVAALGQAGRARQRSDFSADEMVDSYQRVLESAAPRTGREPAGLARVRVGLS